MPSVTNARVRSRFIFRTAPRFRAFTCFDSLGSMDPRESIDITTAAFDDELDANPEGLFDWAVFEAWEARTADDPTSLWSLEE